MTQANRRPPGCFWVIFLVMGLILTVVFGYWMVWLPLRVHLVYVQTSCVVLDKKLDESRGDDEPTYRPLIHIEYTADGRLRRAWTYDASGIYTNMRAQQEDVLKRFEKGRQYPCWYDPANPDSAVLTRSFSWWSLMLAIPLLFVGVGAGGLIYNRRLGPAPRSARAAPKLTGVEARWASGMLALFFGGFFAAAAVAFTLIFTFAAQAPIWLIALMFFGPFLVYVGLLVFFGARFVTQIKRNLPSPERAAAEQLKAEADAQDEADSARQPGPDEDEDEDHPWPTVPWETPPAPGRELAYRLTSSSSPGCFLFGALAVAAFWNGIVSVFLYQMIDGHMRGRPDWFLTLFLVPFVIVGLVLIGVVFVALVGLVTSLLAGALRVEIADHPLRPGESYDYLVEQFGLFGLRKVRLKLKCTESATYTAGTSTSTATKVVHEADVVGPEPSLAGGLRGSLTVPAEAMHSFDGGHNKISWSLEVSGWLIGFLPYENEYPVIIHPAVGGGKS